MGLTRAERHNRMMDRIFEEARKNGVFDRMDKAEEGRKGGKTQIKQFQIVYKFADVINNIEAETKEEAERIAQDMLDCGDEEVNPIKDTECFEIEIEEVEE